MKKLILSLAMVLSSMLGAFAQSSQMATLTHGTTIASYYGETALSQAYEAAVHGDVITLTGGNFTAVNIGKAITLRGNGAQNNDVNGTLKTTIIGSFTVTIPSGNSNVALLEGFYVYGAIDIKGSNENDHAILRKLEVSNAIRGKSCSPQIIQSKVNEVNAYEAPCKIFCTNCIISSVSGGSTFSYLGLELNHCTIVYEAGASNSTFKNCIFRLCNNNGYYIDNSSNASYCVGFWSWTGGESDYEHNIFANCNASHCTSLGAERNTLFENGWEGSGCDYRLSETSAATYIGDDGTQMGAYGGNTPYDLTPTNPRIKTFSVSATNNNNTLNVRLNVE